MLFSRDLSRLGNVHLASSEVSSPSSSPVPSPYNSEYAFRTPSQHTSMRRFRRSALGSLRGSGGGGGGMEPNLAMLLRGRETNTPSLSAAFQRQCHVTSEMVKRLGLKKELNGHTGCVNCLEWNYEGSLLASGSDDLSVIIWDPLNCRKLVKLRTGHGGNIFSVKFMPESDDSIVVTGAADYRIRVHDLNALAASENDVELSAFLRRNGGKGRPSSEVYRTSVNPPTQVFSCHAGRVKRLATAPGQPFTFWSGAEDGLVMEFDLRAPDLAQATNPKNVLVNLNHHLGLNAEVKCLAVNPLRPHLLAVGANDPYVRVFDRRMLTCSSVKFPNGSSTRQGGSASSSTSSSSSRFSNAPWDQRHALLTHLLSEEGDLLTPESAQYYVAGHLPIKQEDYRRRYRTLASTYLTFSPDGSELLANLGGEQLYLFDLQECDKPKRLDVSLFSNQTQGSSSSSGGSHASGAVPKNPSEDDSDSGKSGNCSDYETNVKQVKLTEDAPSTHAPVTPSGTPTRSPNASLIESLKEKGNQAFNRQHYSSAIALYNEALAVEPGALIYANRAAALMKRSWDGDLYAALRDCHEALKDQTLPSIKCKAHFRLAKCLYELQWTDEALYCIERFKGAFPEHAAKPPCETLARDIKATLFGFKERESQENDKDKDGEDEEEEEDEQSGGGRASSRPTARRRAPRRPGRPRSPPYSGYRLSEKESNWRSEAKDYKLRFAGHCNTTTDIKEANFFGSNGQFIVAGSDDGSFFIWDRNTTNIARVLRGDDSIVNCLQSHPNCCLLASSGIDPVVRLWSPRPDDGIKDEREVSDSDNAAFANQRRMNADPLEVMLMNMGYRVRGSGGASGAEDEDEEEDGGGDEADMDGDARPIVCPTS